MDWFPRNPGEKRPFISFLEAHPALEHLALSRHAIQPIHFTSLEAGSLSKVTTFSGTHQQLQALPHMHRSLESVTFRDPVDTRDVSAPTVATLLRDLTSLTSLKVSFTLHSMYDSGNLLQSLIQSCPLLRHLELTCGHKPSFQLVRGYLTWQALSNDLLTGLVREDHPWLSQVALPETCHCTLSRRRNPRIRRDPYRAE